MRRCRCAASRRLWSRSRARATAASPPGRARPRLRRARSSPGSTSTGPTSRSRKRWPERKGLPRPPRTKYRARNLLRFRSSTRPTRIHLWGETMTTIRWIAATAAAVTAVPLAAASMDGFSPQRLSQHVQTIGSDAYEGRGVNTRAEVKTVDYLIGQFKAAGLQPGGDLVNGHRSWTQAVPLLQSDLVGTP